MMTLNEMIKEAFAEDLPSGDSTTDNLGLSAVIGDAKLIAKEDLVLCGRRIFDSCVKFIAPEMNLNWQFKDGDFVLRGQTVCWLRGDLLKLLKAERVSLNFLGRLSGIASLTRCFAQEVAHTKTKILDTRKTAPLWRALEKEAVRAGGGQNHRMSLSHAILIKDNHIRAAGSIEAAIRQIRKQTSEPIEVECSNLEEVRLALKERVQRILLDNMTTAQIQEARTLIPSVIQVEASGNMILSRVREVAETGVDFISVGAITHSAPSADFSLMFEWTRSEGNG
jgi:nicotinate-nucleotide pyrophosphorylase (carboxylating)